MVTFCESARNRKRIDFLLSPSGCAPQTYILGLCAIVGARFPRPSVMGDSSPTGAAIPQTRGQEFPLVTMKCQQYLVNSRKL